MTHHPNNSVRDHMKWAWLLGCEAVLSSMALMQANNMSGGQKKMMSQHSQGQRDNNNPESHQQQSHQSHHGHHNNHQSHSHHSHMVLPLGFIRKDGHSFHAPRLLDEKDMQASQNIQPTKKKHRKSATPNKLREKVEVEMDINGDDDHNSQVQKNFICEHCYGAFRSSYHLKRHILTHTEFLADGPSATSSPSVWGGREHPQGGEPVILLRGQRRSLFPGYTWAHGHLEPPTAAEQPSGCLTSDPLCPHRQQSSAQWRHILEQTSTASSLHLSPDKPG
ncbi:unnamed protein product [Coregonus sp. 'balchen']|nr:unnamed protein product [Coregonus sp. 'balchen']